MRAAIGLSISAVLLMIGCGGGPLPTGTFRGEHNLPVNPGTDPVIANQLRRVVLAIAEDGKVSLEDGGIPIEGQAVRRGDKVEVEVLAVSGVNVERQQQVPHKLTVTIESDDRLRFNDAVLTRKP